jgi:hypothetical protein
MLTYTLFAGYVAGAGAIVYNLAQIKLQNDYEQEIRALREYDLSCDAVNPEKDLPAEVMVLAKYKPESNQHLKPRPPLLKNEQSSGKELLMSSAISYSNVLDPTRYFEVYNDFLNML